MTDMPLVSIAAINYNNSKFIIETLDSIRDQAYPNIELIIVDDCSTDDCVTLINDWLKSYKGKYKFIQHEINKGVCAAYNSGVKNATGKYFSVIDTDDVMLPGKTKIQVDILEASDEKVGAVYSDAYVMDVEGVPVEGLFISKHRQLDKMPTGNIYEVLLEGNYIPCMTVFLKMAVFVDIGYYDESLIYEDYDMWLRVAEKYEMIFSDFVSAKYRIRPGSLTFTIKNWIYSDAKIFLKHIGASLPMPRLRSLALEAYTTHDKDTMPLIKELAEKTNNRYFWCVYLCWELKISGDVSAAVLKEVQEDSVDAGLSLELKNGSQCVIDIFVTQFCDALSLDVLKGIARDTYYNGAADQLPLIAALANKVNCRYFRTALLLCQFRVPAAYGDVILAKEDTHTDTGILPGIIEGGHAHIAAFVEQNWKLLPLESLKNIACDVYCNEVADRIVLIKELAKKTNNRYFRTAYLLCEFGVPPVFGEKLLVNKKEYIGIGYSYEIKKGDYPDMMEFVAQVCTALPAQSLKEIACNAYYNDLVDAKQFIAALAAKTKSRYIKAVSMLWAGRVLVSEGKEILAGIDENDAAGKGNWFTDIGLRKDISRAGKAS